MIITIQKQQRRWQSADLVPDNSSSHSACLPVEGGWGWVERQWDGGLGIKGLEVPEGMAGVQIGPSVNDYQELLYVCLCKVEVPRVGWLVGLSGCPRHFMPENTHMLHKSLCHLSPISCWAVFFFKDVKFCRLTNTDPPTSNRSKPKRSITTSHPATPHTLNPHIYTHLQPHTRILRSPHVAHLFCQERLWIAQPMRISSECYRWPSGNGLRSHVSTARLTAFILFKVDSSTNSFDSCKRDTQHSGERKGRKHTGVCHVYKCASAWTGGTAGCYWGTPHAYVSNTCINTPTQSYL